MDSNITVCPQKGCFTQYDSLVKYPFLWTHSIYPKLMTPIPYLFYFLFCKGMNKMMLFNSAFCVLLEVKRTLKNPKILWDNFNLNAFVPPYSYAQLSQIA